MSQLLTCYRCPAAKTICSRRDKAKQDAKAGGFRTATFRCDYKRDMYPVGAPATLRAWYPDYDDVKTEAVPVTIIGWVGRKLKVQAEQPWETGGGDGLRTIFKAWPDRVEPDLQAPRRTLCKCGYATTPLGSCVQPFPDFWCDFLRKRTHPRNQWGDERHEPLNEYGPEVSP